MSVTEPHLGCVYRTGAGEAVCTAVLAGGKMKLQLTAGAIAEFNAKGINSSTLFEPFTLSVDDPELVEVFCRLED